MKVYIEPNFRKEDSGEGGIRRVVEMQRKYLPQFGVEVVDDIAKADITMGHGGARPLYPGVPFVSASHGLYWSDYQWQGENNANRRVIDTLLCADAITVPSQWVRNAYVRGILRDPKVIYHGVEPDEWQPQEPGGYVLWNKPRHDAVSNVNDLLALAKQMPDIKFVSTLGNPLPNVKLVGRMPYKEMKGVIQASSVYLATARETFGIGTLEAMASGVPVAGWDFGGQREIITSGETGYLAKPGDYAGLASAVRSCFAERNRLSRNAQERARTCFQWPDKIAQYVALYQDVLARRTASPKVSVIVTCHNLAKYLPDALKSVERQGLREWELIIVDDASTDDTLEVSRNFAGSDPRVKVLHSDVNLKLSMARNYGFAQATGRYVINLDADDKLTPNALELMVKALDENPHLAIAYGSLDILSEDGKETQKNSFPRQFVYLEQMAHLNQLHYAAMMRREVWEQVGGYRERMWRAEDAEFWCRATSYGFRAAKVTEETCLLWRFRIDGKSATERRNYPDIDGDWTVDFPWAIAHSGAEGVEKKKTNALVLPHFETLPFGAPIQDAPIWHRENPLVSIIIPLGPGHERYVIDALDSCIAQTEHRWEAIVVNDTGQQLDSIPGAPYAKIVRTEGQEGPAVARNLGIKAARAPLVLFLDADDTLDPHALELMLAEYGKGNAGYVYSGWTVLKPDKQTVTFQAKPYDPMAWFIGKNDGRNIVSVLIATEDARRIGFDEDMLAYEDWDFFCKCAVQGVCGVPLDKPLVTYRTMLGQRSINSGKAHHTELVQLIRDRYDEYVKGAKVMAKCCGGNKKAFDAIQAAREAIGMRGPGGTVAAQTVAPSRNAVPGNTVPEGYTRMRFTGDRTGPVTYYVQGVAYTGANTDENRFVLAQNGHVAALERMNVWARVRPMPPPPPPPPPPPVNIPVPIPEPPKVVEPPKPQVAPVVIPVAGGEVVSTAQVPPSVETPPVESVAAVPAQVPQAKAKRGRPRKVNR